ncbi:peroxiredoxin [Aliikangiella sp. IMCC44653]
MKLIILTLSLFFSMLSNASVNQWEGLTFPSFSLYDQSNQLVSNKNYAGKWLVVYFYPKDKTPGCTVEAQNFTDSYAQFKQLNTDIVGVSYDSVTSHKEFADLYQLPFSLLADTEATLSKALKVDRLLPWPHASRQTFLVNPDGIIVKHFADVKPNSHAAELLKLLKTLQ